MNRKMFKTVRIIRIGRNFDNNKYFFQYEDVDGECTQAFSSLSNEQNLKIFNDVDAICRPKKYEPGLFKLLCKIGYDGNDSRGICINPIITEFISLEETNPDIK